MIEKWLNAHFLVPCRPAEALGASCHYQLGHPLQILPSSAAPGTEKRTGAYSGSAKSDSVEPAIPARILRPDVGIQRVIGRLWPVGYSVLCTE